MCNPSSRGANALFQPKQASGTHMVQIHTFKQNTLHIKINLKNKRPPMSRSAAGIRKRQSIFLPSIHRSEAIREVQNLYHESVDGCTEGVRSHGQAGRQFILLEHWARPGASEEEAFVVCVCVKGGGGYLEGQAPWANQILELALCINSLAPVIRPPYQGKCSTVIGKWHLLPRMWRRC